MNTTRALWMLSATLCLAASTPITGCLTKVERVCEQSEQCQGYDEPKVCFRRQCVTKICDPDPDLSQPVPCGENKGSCRQGVRFCLDNGARWSSCIGEINAQEEICDLEDNDCDGQVDETLDCTCPPHASRPCATWLGTAPKPPSTCQGGVQSCLYKEGMWRWGPCVGQLHPQRYANDIAALKTCQDVYLSCMSQPDPATERLPLCACQAGDTRECYTADNATKSRGECKAGTQECITTETGSVWGTCVGQRLPQHEQSAECNGKDDDCDGQIDNVKGSSLPIWKACGDPQECKSSVCREGVWGLCESNEFCGNQQDDNCDGKIDETTCIAK